MALVPDLINKWLGKRLVVKGVILYPGTGLIEDAPTVDGSTGLLLPNGTAAAPSHSFKNDADTGMYRSAANTLGFAVGGSLVASLDANQWLVPAGTAALPSLGFIGDPNTGWYSKSADVMGLSLGGVASIAIGIIAPLNPAADDTAGQDTVIAAPSAGASATAARVGGALSHVGGVGSSGSEGSGTVDAGAGGAYSALSGDGGAASSTAGAQGGASGTATYGSGAGGSAAGTDPGGASGAVALRSGVGGAKTGTGAGNGGASGTTTVSTSNGGATAGTSRTGGAAGNVLITGGDGGEGTGTTSTGGKGASIIQTPGAGGVGTSTNGKDGCIIERGIKLVKQDAPTAKTVSATLTVAELLVGVITVNQAGAGASALQLPTCSDLDAALPDAATGDAFDFSLINISTVDAEDASLTTNTGWTLTSGGSMEVHARSAEGSLNSSGRFRAYKTGSATWSLLRIA